MRRAATAFGLISILFLLVPVSSLKYNIVPCSWSEMQQRATEDFVCVIRGDTLWGIYEDFNVKEKTGWSKQQFAQKNNIPYVDYIYVEQKIAISEKGLEYLGESAKVPIEYEEYTVKEGESLWHIWLNQNVWERYGVPFSEFLEKNREEGKLLRPDDPNYLKPGQTILIPKQSQAPPPKDITNEFVFDNAGVIEQAREAELENKLREFYTTNKIIVILETFTSFKDEDEAREYMEKRFTDQIGKKTGLDRVNVLDMLIVFVKQLGNENNKVYFYGYFEGRGGTNDEIVDAIGRDRIEEYSKKTPSEYLNFLVGEVLRLTEEEQKRRTEWRTKPVEEPKEKHFWIEEFYGIKDKEKFGRDGRINFHVRCKKKDESGNDVAITKKDGYSIGVYVRGMEGDITNPRDLEISEIEIPNVKWPYYWVVSFRAPEKPGSYEIVVKLYCKGGEDCTGKEWEKDYDEKVIYFEVITDAEADMLAKKIYERGRKLRDEGKYPQAGTVLKELEKYPKTEYAAMGLILLGEINDITGFPEVAWYYYYRTYTDYRGSYTYWAERGLYEMIRVMYKIRNCTEVFNGWKEYQNEGYSKYTDEIQKFIDVCNDKNRVLTEKCKVIGKLKDGKRIDVVFVGENYENVEDFRKDAEKCVNKGLLGADIIRRNADKFNFYWVNEIRDDVRDSLYSLAENCPWDTIIVLENEVFRSYASDGIAYVSTRNIDIDFVTLHEFGHSFFGLADEYIEEDGLNKPEPPNCADNLNQAMDWWGDLAKKYEEVGYYPGCSYVKDNIKPTKKSVMSGDSSEPFYFGPVNERHMQKVIDEFFMEGS